MTEADWAEAYDPLEMIEALRDVEQGVRLWRYVVLCLDGIGEDQTADLLRRRASGMAVDDALARHRIGLEGRARLTGGGSSLGHRPIHLSADAQKARAGLAALEQPPWNAVERVTQTTQHLLQRTQCSWLRCLFPNPFRPVAVDPSWLTSDVIALASQLSETEDFSLMPILADALQDAGCDCADVLGHCRDPKGVHVRGCWVVDLVLGKS